jgi:hypothetical protein
MAWRLMTAARSANSVAATIGAPLGGIRAT